MIFASLLIAAATVALIGTTCALDSSHDAFHPLVFIGPMMAFLYGWMPWNLLSQDGLSRYFDTDQMTFVATLNLLGVLAFVVCCLGAGVRIKKKKAQSPTQLSRRTLSRLLTGGMIAGTIGLLCWLIAIVNVGGFVNAFSTSYSGGWDTSGYIRDGSTLLLIGIMMAVMVRSSGGPRWPAYAMIVVFGLPWLSSALLMARRGPTFELTIVLLMSWYMNRKKRPPLIAVTLSGVALGWLVLFLVTNRQSIYLGSNFDLKTDVSDIVKDPGTGNEWIYGAGTVLSARRADHYYWMRRYLAQVAVRPIPSSVWPTKYEDFGVPELLHNAGTGEGFGDALGWKGADGSAPGIVADLWVEAWWFAIACMGLLGWGYGTVWKKAVIEGGPWASQFVIISAVSIYMVMQTMEAVIFRTLLLSIPSWLIWRYALSSRSRKRRTVRRSAHRVLIVPSPAQRITSHV